MDKMWLGQRLAEARELAGMTQESVARSVGLDRTAVVLLEKGERNLRVQELVLIAQALGRPLSYFVEPPVPAAVSRRSSPQATHDTTRALDAEIDQFATDLRTLVELGLIEPVTRADLRVPRTHAEAEDVAIASRRQVGLDAAPIPDLGRLCEEFGLYTYAVGLGEAGPDGGCVEVRSSSSDAVGAAVINGDAASGRRRMTLAHELGHWLFGDAYDTQASPESERMINSFAIHLLAPRGGVIRVWSDHESWPLRDRALAVGVAFRLSWSATISQLRNLELVSHGDRDWLSRTEPRAGDYLRLALSWTDELESGYLSPGFTAACLTGYTSSKLTESKVLELLRGLLGSSELPELQPPSLDELRRSFDGHGTSRSDV